MTRKIYCYTCEISFVELPADVALAPDCAFTCRGCYAADDRVKGFNVAHDPRLGRNSNNPKLVLPSGFHQVKPPKPIKGPTWSYSDEFLRELVTDRSDEEKGKALVLVIGRWRQWKTIAELAVETRQSVDDARSALSALRREGNALWEKKQRAAVKAERNRQLSLRAQELFARDLTVRQVAGILKVSVGLASELRQAS
jgi:hypothetical protein